MQKLAQLTALFIAFITGNVHAQPVTDKYTQKLLLIDRWLDAQRDFDRLPGLAVAIIDDQKIIFQKAYGYADVEKKIPMQPETIFSICSISKLFTSIAIMQLWEQHKLRLDDSLQALLPDYPIHQRYSGSGPITVRSLLTHSSGLTRDADSTWNGPTYHFLTTQELKQSLSSQETLYPASTYFLYSNLGTSLLGAIVARQANQPYNNYVEQHILGPLQLTNTHPYLPEALWRGRMATGYSALSRQGSRRMEPLFKTNAITPAAGYSSNVVDMAKFMAWQFRLLAADRSELLKSASLKEMQRIQWSSPDKKLTWGLGYKIEYIPDGPTTLGHEGSCPGYASMVMIDPKSKLGVSLMINAQGVDVFKYSDQLFKLLLKVIPADTTSQHVELTAYQGNYDSTIWKGEDIIVPYEGKLLLFGVPTGSPADAIQEYRYVKENVFRLVRPDDGTLGEELIFERDAQGKVTRARSFSRYMTKLR